MASSSQRPEQVYRQEYIARVRYRNDLPHPPIPPKLLDIPGTGLAGSQYTTPQFASRLAREQPLNIEVDAELGMYLDLVGMPGIFDGDESSIQAPALHPTPHPRDRALLRPLASLGKPASSLTSNVSFLRRTEYISTEASRTRFESNTSKNIVKSTALAAKKRIHNPQQADPMNMLRAITKGFDIAYPETTYKGQDSHDRIRGHPPTNTELNAWKNPKHPTKPHLTLLDTYPVLPDFEAFPDSGGYVVVKFATNPVPPTNTYNERMNVALLNPMEQKPEQIAAFKEAQAAYAADLDNNPFPCPKYDYEFFLPAAEETVKAIKRKADVNDPENENGDLYTHTNKEGQRFFKYNRIRPYETVMAVNSTDNKYDEVALVLYDPEADDSKDSSKKRKVKGAYYYPVIQKMNLRAKRAAVSRKAGAMKEDRDPGSVDQLEITINDPTEAERAAREHERKICDPDSVYT